jgi:hypothetical protein
MMRRAMRKARFDSSGFTITEVLISSIAAAVVIAAVVTMYITSLDAWDLSGAQLAIQRNGDLTMEWIVKEIRAGSRVTVGSGQHSLTIYRATATGDSISGHFELDGSEIKNMYGVVLTDNVTDLTFTSGNGVKVWVEMTLEDDLGTTNVDTDDKIIELTSVAVCRNQSLY